MNASPVKQGDILAGKYRVERVLGVGGMGVVVAATHLDLFELRAIKFMIPSALSDAEAVERFLREARAAARLKSEHVAKVHDVGRLENGSPYMVMEYLEGSDLNDLAKRYGSLPPANVALYAIQVCQALAEAHALGIVHRDLKPANLFLTTRPDGSPCVKVLDFGISKVLGGATPGAEFEVTKTNEVLGSPSYMSPEQLHSAKSVDARTDIWAMGVILYRLIGGAMPFRGENITELITRILGTTPPPLSQLRPGVPQGLDAVILGGCLRQDREQRYPNVAALAAALAPFAAAGAGTAVESANRLVGAPTISARPALPSYSGSQNVTVGAIGASSQAGERTTNAWGATAALGGSKGRLVLLLGAGSALLLMAAITFALTYHPAPSPAASPLPIATEAPATSEAPQAPAIVTAPPAVEEASVAPVITAAPRVIASTTATATPTVVAIPSTPPTSAKPVAAPVQTSKPSAAPAKKPPAQPAPDPFGTGRK